MELVATLRAQTLRGAEKLTAWWRQGWPTKLMLLFSALLLALMAFAVLNALAAPRRAANLAPQQVSGVFADVNGDGLVDYIVNAEVIVNKGPLGP